MTDLGPAVDILCGLVAAVPASDLGRPTPCTEYTVGDLLHHVAGVTVAFGGAAVKARGESADMRPWGDASKLDPDWRTSLLLRVGALAGAWRNPEAWAGMTRVGGADVPAEMTGIILLGNWSSTGGTWHGERACPSRSIPARWRRCTSSSARTSAQTPTAARRSGRPSRWLRMLPP